MPGTVDQGSLSPSASESVSVSPYFCDGGVSTKRGSWMMIEDRWRESLTLPHPESDPPWTCPFCGSENPPDTWNCSHCPAPRRSVTTQEQAIWQPPTRVTRDEEGHFTLAEPAKPPPPWWVVVLMMILWTGVTGPGLFAILGFLFAPGPIPFVLACLSFICFYVYGKLRGPFRARYKWGIDG